MAYSDSGIYKIQSKRYPDRIYIGSAVSIRRRFSEHLRRLGRNKHENQKLQNHCNKYGIEDLQFSVLMRCKKENLILFEQSILDDYEPYFNIRKIAENQFGTKRTKEQRRRMSEAKKGIPLSEEHKAGLKANWHNRKPWSEGTLKKRSESMKKLMVKTGFRPPSQKGRKRAPEQIKRWRESRNKNKIIN